MLDARVENLVVEKGRRLGFEEDTSPLLFDYLVVLSRQRDDAELQVRLRPYPLGGQAEASRLGGLFPRPRRCPSQPEPRYR